MISIAIDDFEFPTLSLLVENHFEILGKIVVRSNPAGRSTSKGFSLNHEYTIFAANNQYCQIGFLDRNQTQINRYSEKDAIGQYEWVNFRKHGGLRSESPRMYYPIYISDDRTARLPKMNWTRYSLNSMFQKSLWDIIMWIKLSHYLMKK